VTKLIFGCGYLGICVARRWRAEGHTVYAVTRRAQRGIELEKEGLLPIVADVTRPATLARLPAASCILYAVGYDPNEGHSMRQVYVEGLRSALAALAPATERFIYISSTGVYGQTDGGWVDEGSDCQPTRLGGQVALEAEQVLWQHGLGARSITLRMAGIYGPGRVPRREELLGERPIAAPERGHLNLIHVQDAASAILASETSPWLPRLYVISDGHPVRRHEYCRYLARLMGAPQVRFVEPSADSAKARRATSDKLIRNQRMLDELKVTLTYPSYREGLAASVDAPGRLR
jgi:nucleoside-diphosphate-sugar epimerase